MNTVMWKTVANSDLPHLTNLLAARKQARWQWRNCADEHKHAWTVVIDHVDNNIRVCEERLGNRLDISGFRMKREIVE